MVAVRRRIPQLRCAFGSVPLGHLNERRTNYACHHPPGLYGPPRHATNDRSQDHAGQFEVQVGFVLR